MGDLAEFQASVREFARERDWEQFHDIRSLVLALTGEVGEVAELVQWLPQSPAGTALDPALRERLGEEIADVLTYLVRLADVAGIDVLAAAEAKLQSSRERFPADEVHGRAPTRL